jgi:hypothetical protein
MPDKHDFYKLPDGNICGIFASGAARSASPNMLQQHDLMKAFGKLQANNATPRHRFAPV